MQHKIIGYRILYINNTKDISKFETTINHYLNMGWTLKGTTINANIGKKHFYIQHMIKYSGNIVYPRICKYQLYIHFGYTSKFECDVVRFSNNLWTLYGDMFHAIDNYGMYNYSQALVQYTEKPCNVFV